MDNPKIPPNNIKGLQGEALVKFLLVHKAQITKPEPDYGIDYICELYINNFASNRTFRIQVKTQLSKPYIEKTTKKYFLESKDPVYVIWIKHDNTKGEITPEELFNTEKYYKKYPSNYDETEDPDFKIFNINDFINEINQSYDNKSIVPSTEKMPQKDNIRKVTEETKKITKSLKLEKEYDKEILEALKETTESYSKDKTISKKNVLRLYLLASSKLYHSYILSEIYGNHEINLLYKNKSNINLVGLEKNLVLRTLFSDKYNLKSGWYWFQKDNEKRVILMLFITLLEETSEDVKVGILSLLKLIWEEKFIKIIANFMKKSQSERVIRSVVELLVEHPSKESLMILKSITTADSDLKKKTDEGIYKILQKINLHDAVNFLITHKNIYLYGDLDNEFKSVFNGELGKLFLDNRDSIRVAAYKELVRRNALTIVELKKNLLDKSWEIKYISLEKLINENETFTISEINEILKEDRNSFSLYLSGMVYGFSKEKLLKKVYFKLDRSKLEEHVEWSISGALVYEILGKKYWNDFSKIIREDLQNSIQKRYPQLIEKTAKNSKLPTEVMIKSLQEFKDFIESEFLESGLEVILDKGDEKDLIYAYKYYDYDKFRIRNLCNKILIKFGKAKEANFLFEKAEEEKNISLLIDSLKINNFNVYKGLTSENEKSISTSLDFINKNNIKLGRRKMNVIKSFLYSENDNIRLSALKYIIINSSRKELETLLSTYIQKDSYYYNVISILDRILYSPKSISKNFYDNFVKS